MDPPRPEDESGGKQSHDGPLASKLCELTGKLESLSQSMRTIEAEKDLFAARLDFMSTMEYSIYSPRCMTLT